MARPIPALTRPEGWQTRAACKDAPERLFHPPPGSQHTNTRTIANYCRPCPVRAQCLAWALAWEAHDQQHHGIYGGHTARERRKLARKAKR